MAKMKLYIPHGTLPTIQQFWRAYLEIYSPNHPIRFRKDSRLHNCDLCREEYWHEIKRAKLEGSEESLAWCSKQLRSINIEWR